MNINQVSVIQHKNYEEVVGRKLQLVIAMAARIGYTWPCKCEKVNGMWINRYTLH